MEQVKDYEQYDLQQDFGYLFSKLTVYLGEECIKQSIEKSKQLIMASEGVSLVQKRNEAIYLYKLVTLYGKKF